MSSSSIQLTWNVSVDTGGSGLANYRVYRNGTLVGSPTATTFTDTALQSYTTYNYTVAARDNANNISAQSPAISVTTPRELVFSDNFDRPNGNLGSPNWVTDYPNPPYPYQASTWLVQSNQAAAVAVPGYWTKYTSLSTATVTNFKATVRLTGQAGVGIVIWGDQWVGRYIASISGNDGYGGVSLSWFPGTNPDNSVYLGGQFYYNWTSQGTIYLR